MKAVKWVIWTLLGSSCIFTFLTLQKLYDLPNSAATAPEAPGAPGAPGAGQGALPFSLTPQGLLNELRPGGLAQQGWKMLLGDDAAELAAKAGLQQPATSAAAPTLPAGRVEAVAKAAPRGGPMTIVDTQSQGGVRVSEGSSTAAPAKGHGVIIDSEGRRFELTSLSTPTAAAPKAGLLERLTRPSAAPEEPVAPAKPADATRSMRLLGLGAGAGLAAVLLALRRFRP